jgi:hypothetical protein
MAFDLEAAELLDVQMDQLAGLVPLVADHRRVQVPGPAQTRGPQDPADRGRRDARITGDLLTGEALAAKGDDLIDRRGGVGR